MYYPLMSAGALNSLFFGVYGVSLKYIIDYKVSKAPHEPRPQPTYWDIYWAGCVGGTVQLAVTCPVELAKVKLQTQVPYSNRKHQCEFRKTCLKQLVFSYSTDSKSNIAALKGPYEVLKSLYHDHGIRSWYKGLVPMAWR